MVFPSNSYSVTTKFYLISIQQIPQQTIQQSSNIFKNAHSHILRPDARFVKQLSKICEQTPGISCPTFTSLITFYLVFRCCISSNSAISSSNCTVSAGFAIHAVVHARRALKSFAPAERNWSPTWSVLLPSMPPKKRWQASTPHDLSPISTNTSLPPSKVSLRDIKRKGRRP